MPSLPNPAVADALTRAPDSVCQSAVFDLSKQALFSKIRRLIFQGGP